MPADAALGHAHDRHRARRIAARRRFYIGECGPGAGLPIKLLPSGSARPCIANTGTLVKRGPETAVMAFAIANSGLVDATGGKLDVRGGGGACTLPGRPSVKAPPAGLTAAQAQEQLGSALQRTIQKRLSRRHPGLRVGPVTCSLVQTAAASWRGHCVATAASAGHQCDLAIRVRPGAVAGRVKWRYALDCGGG